MNLQKEVYTIVVKSQTIASGACHNQTSTTSGNYDEQLLQSVNSACAEQIVIELTKVIPEKFRPAPFAGEILKVADYGVLVKMKEGKVSVGDALEVYELEELDEDISEEKTIGRLKVKELKPKYCVCENISASQYAKGQLVKKMAAKTHPLPPPNDPPQPPLTDSDPF